jgi:hypothetical protein
MASIMGFELNDNVSERQLPDILHSMDDSVIEPNIVGNYAAYKFRLVIDLLDKFRFVDYDDDALAMAVPWSAIADFKFFLKHEEVGIIVNNAVFLGRNAHGGPDRIGMVGLYRHFQIVGALRLRIALPGFEHSKIAALHRTSFKSDGAEGDNDAAAALRGRGRARRIILHDANKIVLQRRRGLKQEQ